MTAVNNVVSVLVKGKTDGTSFDLFVNCASADVQIALVQTGSGGPLAGPWAFSHPPGMANVRATERLTEQQAHALAEKCVFKYYRILNIDPKTKQGKLNIPSFGQVERVTQIVLQDSTLDIIQPFAGDATFMSNENPARPLVRYFYDGFEKTAPPTCYGSFAIGNLAPTHIGLTNREAKGNTGPETEVPISFSMDKEKQLIKFSSPVFMSMLGGICAPADLVLETAIQLLDPKTNAVIRYYRVLDFRTGFGTGPLIIRRPDVVLNYMVRYDPGRVIRNTLDDQAFNDTKADYYLRGAASKYEIRQGLDRSYNGLRHIVLDGSIAQVTWDIGMNGVTTRASKNSEHAHWLPDYPERLKLESQAPAQREAAKASAGNIAHIAEGKKS